MNGAARDQWRRRYPGRNRLRPAARPAQKKDGREIAFPPVLPLSALGYLRLLIAVRSADSLTMPAAPHHLEPAAVAVKSPVKRLQFAIDRSVSE